MATDLYTAEGLAYWSVIVTWPILNVYVNVTSQPINERLRKAVFWDLKRENLMFAFIKMQNE